MSPTWHHFGGKHQWFEPRSEAQRRAHVLDNHFGEHGLVQGLKLPQIASKWFHDPPPNPVI